MGNETMTGLAAALAAGDVVREEWPSAGDPRHLHLFLGNGRAGGCFDRWGLQNVAGDSAPVRGNNPTHLRHADVWDRDAHGIDGWLPLARWRWEGQGPGEAPSAYRQHWRLLDGTLTTSVTLPGLELTTRVAFDPRRRDLAALEIVWHGFLPPIVLDFFTPATPGVGRELAVDESANDGASFALVCGTATLRGRTRLLGARGLRLEPLACGFRLRAEGGEGRGLWLLGVAATARAKELDTQFAAVAGVEDYFASCAAGWLWRYRGNHVVLPVAKHQALWARCLHTVLASYAPDVRAPAAPMGWAGLSWNYDFPQDLSFVQPALLALGHHDVAKAWVEFFAACIPACAAYTARRWGGARGVCWPWNMPVTPDSPLRIEETPEEFQYQIHNAAYPAKMALETALALGDADWARAVALPVVCASAEFYASVLTREPSGAWGIRVVPASGQDEYGGRNAPLYLCALFAARFTLRAALRALREWGVGHPDAERWRGILRDGLAFAALYDREHGVYATNAATPVAAALGHQKHPVQLDPFTFLPEEAPEPATLRAGADYRRFCEEPGRPVILWGWTMQAYWLAAARRGDGATLRDELARAEAIRNVDPDWIQIYESSDSWYPWFVTGHGVYLHMICEALRSPAAPVNPDWRGARLCVGAPVDARGGALA